MIGPFLNNDTYKSGVYCVNQLVSLITSELLKRKMSNNLLARYNYVGVMSEKIVVTQSNV